MARLVNTSKVPLGRVSEIMAQVFVEDQRLKRKAIADTLEVELQMTATDWQAGRLSGASLKTCQAVVDYRRVDIPIELAKLLAPPGRCTERRAGGRCRGVPHRFATFVQCPLHHSDDGW